MALDTKSASVTYSDDWWFKRLFDAFHHRAVRRDGILRDRVTWANYLWSWYIGNPDLPRHTEGWQQQVTLDVLRMGRANFAMLAVDSKLDRIQLEAFKTADNSDDEDETEGPEATSRKLMRKYASVFDDALLFASVMNEGYIWVGREGKDGLATVTAEDPRSCVTIDDPLDPTNVIAALKMYRNDTEKLDYAHVVLPAKPQKTGPDGEVIEPGIGHRIRVATRQSNTSGVSSNFNQGGWEWNDELSAEYPTDVQDRGPLVHHVLAPNGLGDIEPVLDNLERINNQIVDRLWLSKFQTFRQRAMQEKIDPQNPEPADPMPENDEDGNPIDWDEILSADPGAVWRLPAGMTIWESTPTDMQGALSAVKDDVKEFAAVTRTPIYVFTPDAIAGSATGAGLAREGQVNKAKKWIKRQSRVFLAACADMLAVSGHPVAASSELELKWAPTERVTLMERAQAGNQAKAAGVPQEGVWEDWMQSSPETIERYKRQRTADVLFQPPVPAEPAPTRPADVPTPAPVVDNVNDDGLVAV